MDEKASPHLRSGFSIGGIPLRAPLRTTRAAPEFRGKKKLPATHLDGFWITLVPALVQDVGKHKLRNEILGQVLMLFLAPPSS